MYNSGVTNCYSFKHGLEVHKKYLDFICKEKYKTGFRKYTKYSQL